MQEHNSTPSALNGLIFGTATTLGWWLTKPSLTFATAKFAWLDTLAFFVPILLASSMLLFVILARWLFKQGLIHNALNQLSPSISLRWLLLGTLFGLTYPLIEQYETTYGSSLVSFARLLALLLGFALCFLLIRPQPRPTQ